MADLNTNYNAQHKPAVITSATANQSAQNKYKAVQPQADKFELQNKTAQQDKNKKIIKLTAAGIGIAGVITAGLLIAKGKFSKAKDVFNELKFEPAKTLQDAEAFAKNVLKLEKVNYSGDLEIANITNEAFTNCFNKGKGRFIMPKEISVQEMKGFATCLALEDKITINKNLSKKLDEALRDTINKQFSIVEEKTKFKGVQIFSNDYYDDVESKLNSFRNKPESFDLKAKLDLFLKLDAHNNQLFFKMNNPAYNVRQPRTSAFDIIYHELGHYQHYKNSPENYAQLASLYKNDKGERIIPEFWQEPKLQQLGQSISMNASGHPLEYVADVFKEIINGEKHSDLITQLYKELGGVSQ